MKSVDGLHYRVVDIRNPWLERDETIIFHHGAGSISGVWSEWIPVLADRYRIVAFDMRGMGESAAAAKEDHWSFESYADDVISVADAVGTENFHFVGESFGGTVGLVLGLRHPDRASTITVSNASHIGSAIQNVENWESELSNQGADFWSRGMMPKRFFDGALSKEKWDWYHKQQSSHPPESLIKARKILVAADLKERLRTLATPVLILHPDGSPFVPIQVTADLVSRLPNVELHVVGHAKHGLPFSHSAQCAAVLQDFLSRASHA
ncbi:MAG: alpha/beta hydrolase [Rhizobiaceae bacterium]